MLVTITGMDATTARTENMRRLVAEAGGQSEWTRLYGGTRWQPSQVSQWISETKPKGIGGNLARDLEAAMGLANGELDRPPSTESHAVGIDIPTLRSAHRLMQMVAEIRGDEPVPDINVAYLAMAYETVAAEASSLDDSNILDFMRAFAARLDKAKGDEDGSKRGKAAGTG